MITEDDVKARIPAFERFDVEAIVSDLREDGYNDMEDVPKTVLVQLAERHQRV